MKYTNRSKQSNLCPKNFVDFVDRSLVCLVLQLNCQYVNKPFFEWIIYGMDK